MAQAPALRPRILHVVGTASSAGSGITQLIQNIDTRLSARYRFHVLFLSDDQGPLPGQLRSAGMDVSEMVWTRGAAELRGMTDDALAAQVEENFLRLFGGL